MSRRKEALRMSATPGRTRSDCATCCTISSRYIASQRRSQTVRLALEQPLQIPSEFADIAAICAATDVEIGGAILIGVPDARLLHTGLAVGRDYTNWIKDRIVKFGFVQGQDFEVTTDLSSPNPASAKSRAQVTSTYTITLDMAKHLAMVENNDIGRLVRRYFIWAEKNAGLLAQPHVAVASLDEEARRVLGGMIKASQEKQRGLILADVRDEFAPILTEMRKLIVTHQTGTAAVQHRSALELCVEAGAHQKKRRHLAQRVSGALRAVANLHGVALLRCARTRTWLFPAELSMPFMSGHGAAMVRMHNAEVALGQQPVRLTSPSLHPIRQWPWLLPDLRPERR